MHVHGLVSVCLHIYVTFASHANMFLMHMPVAPKNKAPGSCAAAPEHHGVKGIVWCNILERCWNCFPVWRNMVLVVGHFPLSSSFRHLAQRPGQRMDRQGKRSCQSQLV